MSDTEWEFIVVKVHDWNVLRNAINYRVRIRTEVAFYNFFLKCEMNYLLTKEIVFPDDIIFCYRSSLFSTPFHHDKSNIINHHRDYSYNPRAQNDLQAI